MTRTLLRNAAGLLFRGNSRRGVFVIGSDRGNLELLTPFHRESQNPEASPCAISVEMKQRAGDQFATSILIDRSFPVRLQPIYQSSSNLDPRRFLQIIRPLNTTPADQAQ